jgi:hypothetical protein
MKPVLWNTSNKLLRGPYLICHEHDLLIVCKLDELLQVVVAQALARGVACKAAAAAAGSVDELFQVVVAQALARGVACKAAIWKAFNLCDWLQLL